MMNIFKKLFNFYINASIHVAMAVVALALITYIQFKISINYTLLLFIFLCSVTGYNFVKFAPIAKLHHRSLTEQLKQIQVFSFVVFIGLFICMFFVNLQIIVFCLILGIITLLYAIPLGKKNLREIALLKVFVIAFIWASTTFILPFSDDSFKFKDFSKLLNFHFFERILWVVLLMIPFEIRDLRFDKKHLKTLVSIFGVWPVKVISFVILILLLSHKIYTLSTEFLWIFICIYLSLAIVILLAKPVQKPYYSSFYVEALPIIWMILAYF